MTQTKYQICNIMSKKFNKKNHHEDVLDKKISLKNDSKHQKKKLSELKNNENQESKSQDNLKDIFGNIIIQFDMSNPLRSRIERPLDTIRSFEYAFTRNNIYKMQLETQNLGWELHGDFPFFRIRNGMNNFQNLNEPNV